MNNEVRHVTEAEILASVAERSGLRYPNLASIGTREASVSRRVLPILSDWLQTDLPANLRGALYVPFSTKEAVPYLDVLLECWSREPQDLNFGLLSQTIEQIVTARTAERVWATAKVVRAVTGRGALLSRLAKFKTISDEVAGEVIQILDTRPAWANKADLMKLARIRHPAVLQWLEAHPEFDTHTRPLTSGSTILKRGAFRREHEVWSTEVDLVELPRILHEWQDRFAFRNRWEPGVLMNEVTQMPVDQWRYMLVEAQSPLVLWFRLEDVDVVEIVLGRA